MQFEVPPIHTTTFREVVEPQTPHEDLSFEQLARCYSFDQVRDRRRLFVRLILKEIQQRSRPIRVLDIGCGHGIGGAQDKNTGFLRAIRAEVDELWGVEPDAGVHPEHGLFDDFQHATMETAEIPPQSVDVAYSFFVMEHVANPRAFLESVERVLKPGGCYLFVTPNARHMFTILARSLKALRLDEFVLKALRKDAEEYHYPVQYRVNTRRTIERHTANTGFLAPQYAYFERAAMKGYFPGPLRPVRNLLMLKRRLYKNPRSLFNLTCRLVKPSP